MALNQSNDQDFYFYFSKISYVLSGPVTFIIVFFGTIFNLVTIFILSKKIIRRRVSSRDNLFRFETIYHDPNKLVEQKYTIPMSARKLSVPSSERKFSSCERKISSSKNPRRVSVSNIYECSVIKKGPPKIYIFFLWLTSCDIALQLSSVMMYSVPILFDCYNGYYANLIPLWYMMCNFTFSVAVLLMLALMIERYRTLCCPFPSAVMALSSSPLRTHITLGVVTFSTLLFSIPRFFEFYVVHDELNNSYIIYQSGLISSQTYMLLYRIIGSLLFYSVFPYLLIFVLSYKIWRKIRAASKSRASMNVQSPSPYEKNMSEKIFIAITIKFLVSRFASTSFEIIEYALGTESFGGSSLAMFFVCTNNLIVVISSTLNFFIFWFCSSSFKKEVSKICKIVTFHRSLNKS